MKKLLFTISQLYKGGAELALVNLLNKLDYSKYSVELLILNQVPVKNAVSLVERVNSKVTICDAYEKQKRSNILDKMHAKLFYTLEQREKYLFPALDFVRAKKYDWAFFFGEWCSPSFVAMEVNAAFKAAWIHSDISKAEFFDANDYFSYFEKFDYYIFVSQHSMQSGVQAYPFIKNKAITIYNINDVEDIRRKAKDKVDDLEKTELPLLLTCANFRQEKNHLRQVEAMAKLKERGVDFIWANIGSTADCGLVNCVSEACRKYGLEDRFLILGPRENPYKYMQMADAITVLSDHESWSMVITEAKILGKPVISTKTSGGLEQIVDKKTGLLADFDSTAIANTISEFIQNKKLRISIEKNIVNFDNTTEILDSFELLVNTEKRLNKRELLYVIDDINYAGGAHAATKLQIKELLKQKKDITIYSSTIPNIEIRKELLNINFISLRDTKADLLYKRRLCNCLFDKNLDFSEKKQKLGYTFRGYQKKLSYEEEVLSGVSKLFSEYQIVCVMSEASAYRSMVANSKAIKKIQWIHTDYSLWRVHNEWTKKITANDREIYKHFDKIIVLTVEIRDRFISIFPELESKLMVNKNLIPVEEIKEKALLKNIKNERPVNFITVGRFGSEKEYPRLIKILAKIKAEGYKFTWTIVGGGDMFIEIKNMIQALNLEKEVFVTGPLDNPFPRMVEADVFALLSSYEGLPNTIYEALILGLPVLATNVGGIATQIEDGQTGWLVENKISSIENKICSLLMDQEEIKKVKENLKMYYYDNESIMCITNDIFSMNDTGEYQKKQEFDK